jgi:hypothetical protein
MNALTRRSIRVVTAILMVVSVGALIAVGVQRSRSMARPASDRSGDLPESKPDDPAVGVYTGFEYVETIAGRAIFALRSLRTLGRSSGWHEIEGVQLQLYDAGVAGPVVTAAGASFNIETRDAELRGRSTSASRRRDGDDREGTSRRAAAVSSPTRRWCS